MNASSYSSSCSTNYYAGLGCRSGCSEISLRRLLEQALQDHGLTLDLLDGLATIDSKRNEPGLQALAQSLHLPLTFFSTQQLAQFDDRLSETSAITLRITGSTSVAEASALALAELALARQGSGRRGQLIIAKRKNADATFALAGALPDEERVQA
ncbi:MAG TPA: cobalamin biosynthesis protein [Spongiibacteraceae bacterium]|nr:cobalamin biosynthesis protein [Spongiibacteraceae bacterium]